MTTSRAISPATGNCALVQNMEIVSAESAFANLAGRDATVRAGIALIPAYRRVCFPSLLFIYI